MPDPFQPTTYQYLFIGHYYAAIIMWNESWTRSPSVSLRFVLQHFSERVILFVQLFFHYKGLHQG